MTGQFRISSNIAKNDVPWGSFRAVTNPLETGSRQLTALDATIAPGKGHDFHMHPDQEEIIWIVAGRIEQWVEREKRILGPGDAVFIPPGVVHSSFNVGVDEARFVAIFGPSIGEGGQVTVDMAGEAPWRDLRG